MDATLNKLYYEKEVDYMIDVNKAYSVVKNNNPGMKAYICQELNE